MRTCLTLSVQCSFVDDPAGYSEEHPQITGTNTCAGHLFSLATLFLIQIYWQTGQVQLSPTDMELYYTGIQTAWSRALQLLRENKKYIFQAYQGPLNAVGPGVVGNPSSSNVTECAAWLRLACAKRDNESARVYSAPSTTDMHDANMSIATFLIARGPHSMISADPSVIEDQRGNRSNPFYNLFYLDVGTPLEHCVESPRGMFSRRWSNGKASIDCSERRRSPVPELGFATLPMKTDDSQHLVMLRHDTAGLRWLDARWAAVTDPLSPDYRLHESREEILRHLVPHLAAQISEVERWLAQHGWAVVRQLDDTLLVRPGRHGTSTELLSFSVADRPDAVALIVPTRRAHDITSSPHTLRRVSPPLPLGLSMSTLREMYGSSPRNKALSLFHSTFSIIQRDSLYIYRSTYYSPDQLLGASERKRLGDARLELAGRQVQGLPQRHRELLQAVGQPRRLHVAGGHEHCKCH